MTLHFAGSNPNDPLRQSLEAFANAVEVDAGEISELTPAEALEMIQTYAQMTDGWCDPLVEAEIERAALAAPSPVAMPFQVALLACQVGRGAADDEGEQYLLRRLVDHVVNQAVIALKRMAGEF